MAVRKVSPTPTAEPWTAPIWPNEPADEAGARVVYGPFADELVVRFAGTAGRPAVAVAIETPERDYVYALADEETGVVVGVQVDDLQTVASRLHPTWRRLAEPRPSSRAVTEFIAEVSALFRRYGAGTTPPER
jgi:hypothetical protein